jgi:hypothetical protein
LLVYGSIQIFFISAKSYGRNRNRRLAVKEVCSTLTNPNRVRLASVAGVSAIIFLFDWFFMVYITSHGFAAKAQSVTLGGFNFSIPIQWLPVLGVLLVSLLAWHETTLRIFPRRGGPETDPLAGARILRVIAFSVVTFVCVLYIPYLLGSNWFWARLSELGQIFVQARGIGLSLLHTQEPLMTLNPLWQYSISQIVATGSMVLATLAFGRVARRPRRPR